MFGDNIHKDCHQIDNIANLKQTQSEIQGDVRKIWKVINGNGDGVGMKTDLALVVQRTEGLVDTLDRLERSGIRQEDKKSTNIMLWLTAIAVAVSIVIGAVSIVKDNRETREWKESVRNLDINNTTTRGGWIQSIEDTTKTDTVK